jgi:hypothetical protein
MLASWLSLSASAERPGKGLLVLLLLVLLLLALLPAVPKKDCRLRCHIPLQFIAGQSRQGIAEILIIASIVQAYYCNLQMQSLHLPQQLNHLGAC